MGYWDEARRWANREVRAFAWWNTIPPAMVAAVRYGIAGGDVLSDLWIALPAVIGTYGLCWAVEYAWLLLVRAPAALQQRQDAEVAGLNAQIVGLARQADEFRPRLSLVVSPHVGVASERWITLSNLGRRTAFDARIQPLVAGAYRLDCPPIAQIRGGERLELSDKLRLSRQSHGVWYTEPRPARGIGEILTDQGALFEEVKTGIEILYRDGGVSLCSRVELAARKEYDGITLRVSGQEFLVLDDDVAAPSRRRPV